MELGTYIIPPEPISTVHIINPHITDTNVTAFEIAEAKP
jgi:hypothetical protein